MIFVGWLRCYELTHVCNITEMLWNTKQLCEEMKFKLHLAMSSTLRFLNQWVKWCTSDFHFGRILICRWIFSLLLSPRHVINNDAGDGYKREQATAHCMVYLASAMFDQSIWLRQCNGEGKRKPGKQTQTQTLTWNYKMYNSFPVLF